MHFDHVVALLMFEMCMNMKESNVRGVKNRRVIRQSEVLLP